MDIMDTTDPMDIGDTMERDLLMKKLQLLDQTLMLRLGMDIMVVDMDMDITDHMDTGVTMERDLLMKPQLLAQTLADADAWYGYYGYPYGYGYYRPYGYYGYGYWGKKQMTFIFFQMHSRFW